MKKLQLLLIIFCLVFTAGMAAAKSDKTMLRWQDPEVFGIGRETMRSSFIAFPADAKAVPGADFRTCGTNYRSIAGTWNFHHSKNVSDPRPADFFKPAFDDTSWGGMPVPGMWELNGYGDPAYTNTRYPWSKFFRNNPPFVPENQNAVGLYRHNVKVPAEWKGKDIFVHIGSATSNLTLWINGKEVGYSEDSKLEAEFNITKFVKPGQDNLFAMQIFRWCDGSYLEDQDFWRMSGIGRDCYIYCREKVRITDVKLTPDLSADYKDGALDVKVETTPGVKAVEYVLCDPRGKEVARCKAEGKQGFGAIFNLVGVESWSAERPSLYTLSLRSIDAAGKTSENIAFNVGFRKIEIKGGCLMVNGRHVLIKGVNRHEMNARTGYYLTREDMMKDIQVMKSLNVNAVRTCHYPNSPVWYDLCDRYGLYVVDEGNIESHGMGYGELTLAKNPAFRAAHLERDRRMMLRDYNHPSVIIWSLGNESGNGQNFMDCYDMVKAYDHSRPVQYEQASTKYFDPSGDNERNTDITCPMYADYDWCLKYAKGKNPKPLIQCEYAHSMGNSLGGFKEYWDIVRANPKYQGGFIWDFADQALAWTDPKSGKLTYRYGGDYNDLDASDGNFNCNGIADAEHNPHPGAYEVKYQYQNIWTTEGSTPGRVRVRNEHSFVGLQAWKLSWELLLNGKPTVLKGEICNLDIQPGETKEYDLGFDAAAVNSLGKGEKSLVVRYLLKEDGPVLKKGFEAAHDQLILEKYDFAAVAASVQKVSSKPTLAISEDGHSVQAAGFKYEFNNRGWIENIEFDGKKMLEQSIEPCFYRPLTDNDVAVVKKAHHKQSWLQGRNPEIILEYFKLSLEGGNAVAVAEYGIAEMAASLKTRYTITPEGKLCIEERFMPGSNAKKYMKNLMRLGLSFAMPGTFDTIEFYGAGPWETYADRQSGAILASYTQKVSGQFHHGYVIPGESGAHVSLRSWAIMDAQGHGLKIISDAPFQANAIPYSIEDLDRRGPFHSSHPSELSPDGLTHVNVDYLQQGLGCVNSWGALPRKEYLIPMAEYSWKFIINKL